MSVRPFLTESSTGRTVLMIPPEGPIERTARAVDPCSETALESRKTSAATSMAALLLRRKKNLLNDKTEFTSSSFYNLLDGLLGIMVIDYNVSSQTLDIVKV